MGYGRKGAGFVCVFAEKLKSRCKSNCVRIELMRKFILIALLICWVIVPPGPGQTSRLQSLDADWEAARYWPIILNTSSRSRRGRARGAES